MEVRRLWLTDFRCYRELELELTPGATVVQGANGQGKTSLLEAVAWTASGRSFRGVPDAVLVRDGAARAIVRVEAERAGQELLIEVEIPVAGRNRILVNRQVVARRGELARALRVTVFAPDDLELVKGGPALRRGYLDDLLVVSAARYDAARADFDRILRHRNALLRAGARGTEDRATLDVFDEQLIHAGGELVRGRLRLAARLEPWLAVAYAGLASDADADADARYEAEWAEGPIDAGRADELESLLARALVARRREELDRGVTLVGPHRDEWRLRLRGRDARTHASQGEQRTLALALRLASHHVAAEVVDENPVLLLDDVFSELDSSRAAALVSQLPPGQTLITTVGFVPGEIAPRRRLHVADGVVRDAR